jgi:hypothetical protein
MEILVTIVVASMVVIFARGLVSIIFSPGSWLTNIDDKNIGVYGKIKNLVYGRPKRKRPSN